MHIFHVTPNYATYSFQTTYPFEKVVRSDHDFPTCCSETVVAAVVVVVVVVVARCECQTGPQVAKTDLCQPESVGRRMGKILERVWVARIPKSPSIADKTKEKLTSPIGQQRVRNFKNR